MVREARGMAQPMRALDHLGAQREKGGPVRIIGVEGRSGVATTGIMTDSTRKCTPQWAVQSGPRTLGGMSDRT